MDFTIKQGLNIPVAGAPRQVIENGPEISSVALSGKDFHGVRPEVLVKIGDRVVTSGMGGVFPKGLVIGKVKSVVRQKFGLFQEIEVAPSVDFSHLEEVLVLLRSPQ